MWRSSPVDEHSALSSVYLVRNRRMGLDGTTFEVFATRKRAM